MQTIWLQRSSPDIPWGFRLVGGREFGLPLSVQRVTPGSVAAAALGPGDVILKVGNVMATNLEHNAAQELVRQATNILQLTIKKGEGPPAPSGPLSPGASGYGSQMSAQLNDNNGYGTTPRSFGTPVPVNVNYSRGNEAPNYATTPRNYGSQHQPPANTTRIEIQRVHPGQQQQGYTNNNNYHSNDTGGPNFPDYTIAYRNQEPIHDSPGGPIDVRGYTPQQESNTYSPRSAPRDAGGFSSGDRDGFAGANGPPGYEPRSYNPNQSSFSPREPTDSRFNTGVPYQPSHQKPQQSYVNTTPQSFQNTYSSTPAQPVYGSAPRSFSPPTSSGPLSPRIQPSSTPVYNKREPTTPTAGQYNQAPAYGSSSNEFDQSNIRGPGSNSYSTLPYSKPSYPAPNNTFNTPHYQPPQKPYLPAQASPSPTYEPPAAFSNSQPRSYQSPLSPGSSSGYMAPPAIVRRVSFDQDFQDGGPYTPSSSFTQGHRKSPPPVTNSSSGYYDYGVSSPQSASFSRQSSRQEDSSNALPYSPQSGPMSPRSESGYGYGGSRGGYDPSAVSDGMEHLNFGSTPSYQPPPPPPPPPPPCVAPPPPPPPGPPPPPAPPLGDWSSTPVKRHRVKPREEQEEQKIPDQLLNTMLKSAKGGGPKPFSYGIDLSELKKKIGPPTAPKPRPGQPNYEEEEEESDVPRQYSGPPRKPAGYVQSDYFIKRDDNSEASGRSHRKPAGQVQSDYYQSRQTGPRSEIDESPINISMGTDPKKQSKSFKVLQWMTETDKDDPEGKKATTAEPSQKARRSQDPEKRHNAEDDEMRFSGLHSKADIPSKAFSVLQRISGEDTAATTHNGRNVYDGGEESHDVGNYDETSIRYKGKSIPSPSFRVLQTWAQHDPLPDSHSGGKEEEDDDELPDTLTSEDMVDKRYKGGNIPSKVFRVLQQSVGADPNEGSSPAASKPRGEGHSMPKAAAPVSDF